MLAQCAAALLSLGLVAFARPGLAAPFTPASDDTVLETLTPPGTPALRELRALAAAERAAPDALAPAIAYARRAVEFARRNGDPRYAGYAEAALRPWINRTDEPPTAAFLDAVLHQYRHDFPQALATLDALLDTDPDNAEMRLVRATVRQVTGDIAGAGADCDALTGRIASLAVATCRAAAMEASGDPNRATRTLEIGLALPAPPNLRLWALTLAAEQAARHGDPVKAEKRYREALAIDGEDLALVSSYADFLLDSGRAREARRLLGSDTRVDAILLRLALAAQAEGDDDAARLIRTQAERFAEAGLRGDASHRREEARFQLHLQDDASGALMLALQNWQVQREPWDARLVLEAALAAHRPEAAVPVRDWLAAHGNDDAQLARLGAALDGAS
jgi:predicted Zn-dependent protease